MCEEILFNQRWNRRTRANFLLSIQMIGNIIERLLNSENDDLTNVEKTD